MQHTFNWSPGIGDPTFAGWATVVLYLVTSWRCFVLARAQRRFRTTARLEYLAWLGLGVVFLALGINKQLDLQTALTELGRTLVSHVGWMEYKVPIQVAFIGVVVLICILASLALAVLFRGAHPAAWLALLGAILVAGFVAIRASSFHHMDQFIGSRFLMLRWNWILEMGGILWSSPLAFGGMSPNGAHSRCRGCDASDRTCAVNMRAAWMRATPNNNSNIPRQFFFVVMSG